MAAIVTCKLNLPDQNNVEITFPVASLADFLSASENVEGIHVRILEPRNPFGSKGMPKDEKKRRLLAELALLED